VKEFTKDFIDSFKKDDRKVLLKAYHDHISVVRDDGLKENKYFRERLWSMKKGWYKNG